MSTATIAPTGTWTVDASHSKVGFAVKHLGIATVRGEFKEFEGTFEIGDDLS
jgi:polyisoprenoid-binding protein YceI